MSPIKWLNNLIILENVIGIYRNYCTQKKIKKYFIVFHIIVLILIKTLVAICEVYVLLLGNFYNQITHIYCYLAVSSYMTCLLSVITGIYSSRAFISYFESINRVAKRFEDDKKLIHSLKKLYWFSIIFVILSITFAVLRSSDIVINFNEVDYDIYIPLCVPIFLSQAYVRFSVLFQELILFVVIIIVVNLSKCLTSLISIVQESIGSYNITLDEQCDFTGEQIQEWVELYRDLLNCCDKVTLCFGRQFFCLLTMSISFYVLLTYQMCYLSVLNIQDQKIAIVIMSYVLLTMFPIVAGQLVLNQGMKFHRLLARLYIKMIVIDSKKAEAKLIKDFIRLIKKNPLEIKLVSKITVGTYLLPVVLMSTVYYIIVMLQFNNIV